MKKLIVLLTAVLVAATSGCGGGSSSLFSYIARSSNSSSTPHLFTSHGTKDTPKAVAITIPDAAAYVSVNRDGNKVTYCHNSDSGYDIFVMGTDNVEKQLTTGADACESVFSPDGKTIAYVSASSGEPGIFTMNADGSNQKALYVAPANSMVQLVPEFSPDGKSVLFFVELSGGLVVGPTPKFPLAPKVPTWAARSAQFKTVPHGAPAPPPGTPTVNGWYTMKLTDTHPTLVYTPQVTFAWGPAVYSTDSKKILFTDYDGDEWNIFSVNLDGTGVAQLTNSTTTSVFSPVAYKGHILFNQYNSDTQSFDIYVMDQDGKNQTLVHTTANTYETLIDTYYSND